MSEEKNLTEQSTPAYWAVIPAAVRYDDRLRPNAKLLYGEISALASAGGYCHAKNIYFAKLYGFNVKTVSALISSLAQCGYIVVEVIRGAKGDVEMRKIWLTGRALMLCPPPHQKVDTSPSNNGGPLHQKAEENNTSINNNTPIVPKIAPKAITDLFADYAAGDAKLLDALLGFAEMRSKKRSPITTARTVTLLTKRLDSLSDGSSTVKIAMLDEATLSGWKTVYPLKDLAALAGKSRVIETEASKAWD